jgi:MFS family permease
MKILLSLIALLASVLFVQLGSGSLGPLDALSGEILNFSSIEIGLIGSAHFLGFMIGCYLTPLLISRVGHSRTFASLASLGAISALAHMIFPEALWWIILRILSGMSVAGTYTVIEIWIQPKLNNQNRGKITGVYRLVDISGTLMAQAMIALLEPATFIAYNIIAVMCCLSILPLSLTTSLPPNIPHKIRLKPIMVFQFSPLAAYGVLVAGLSNSIFRTMGALYASYSGLKISQVALFLVFGILGGALSQVPAGWLADRYDRRYVLIGFSIFAFLSCVMISLINTNNILVFYILILLFGAATFPIFSLSAAHANDFCNDSDMAELNSSLIFTFALGAIISPFLSGSLITLLGPSSMFVLIGLSHVLLIIYGVYRMGIRPTLSEKTPYIYLPRTSAIISWFIKNEEK